MTKLFDTAIAVVTLVSVLLCATAWSDSNLTAGSAEEAGQRLATEARARQAGFGNYTASLRMVLRNRQGKESNRELRLKVIEVEGDGDQTLFVFDRPSDVKGTAFLVHGHKDKPDRQWLYLPALKRVKSITSSNQSGSFMGSEFSYEDMGAAEVEKFDHKYLGDEACGEFQCYVLERVPKSEDSGYSRMEILLDQQELRVISIRYFDRRQEHLKTMTAEGYEVFLDEFWRSKTNTMTNHLTGKASMLQWSNFEFQTDLNHRDFSKTALKRVR
ncbi:MAG: outer membrane lipoprotein-sorting protein [Acidiferrobacterales bacterium]|nr:outer membrane lipoprotein-sorting protein [Acidiferrobacterales bacterium]